MASELRPTDDLEVALTTRVFVIAMVGGLLTMGIALIVAWLISLRYPSRFEPDGVVTRGGARHAWTDLERTVRLNRGSFRLEFSTGTVNVLPRLFADSGGVLDYLRRCGVETGVNVYMTRHDEGE